MPRVYDIVIGEKLSPYYIKKISLRRVEREPIGNLQELIKFASDSLKSGLSGTSYAGQTEVDTVITELNLLNHNVETGSIDVNSAIIQFNEYLALLAQSNIEFFIIDNKNAKIGDLIGTEPRAYMLNYNDELFPTVKRVASGNSQIYDMPELMSTPDIIFNFLETSLSFSNITEDQLGLTKLKERYHALFATKSSWTMSITNLLKFLDELSYRFIGVIDL